MKKIIFIMAVIVLLVSSCTKEQFEKCRSNCARIIFSGKVWDSSYRKGLANIPIRVYWKDAGMSPIYIEDEIAKSKTDDQGNFYLSLSVDSSRFHGNRLYIEVPIPAGYIANDSDPFHPVLAQSLNQYFPIAQNIKFTVYQSVNLKIKLQRTQIDNYIGFELYYLFDFTRGGIYGYFGPPPSPHTDFNVTTAANVYTKVSWQKWLSPGVTSTFADSIKCIANTNNLIVIDY